MLDWPLESTLRTRRIHCEYTLQTYCCGNQNKQNLRSALRHLQARRWSLLPENLTKLLADSRLLHWFTQIHGLPWLSLYEFKQFGCCR